MNIAIGTIVLFIVLLPGIILRRSYLSGKFSRRFVKTKPVEEIIWAIVPGFILQGLGVIFVNSCLDFPFDFKKIGVLIFSSPKSDQLRETFTYIQNHFGFIAIYNFTLWIIAFYFGYIFRKIIRFLKLDRKQRIFRFNNHWHYVLSGEILDFPGYGKKSEYVDVVYIDIRAKSPEGSVYYIGRLREYFLKEDGRLASVCVGPVKRKENGHWEDIPSDTLIIPFEEIINVNLRYYKDPDEKVPTRWDRFCDEFLIFGWVRKLIIKTRN